MNDDIQRALEVIADRGSDPGAATLWHNASRSAAEARVRRRRFRRGSVASLVVVVTIAAVVVALVAVPGKNSRPETLRVDPHGATPAVAGAAQLAAGHWSTLPRAPIAARTDPSVVWTGHELIVWGGATGASADHLRADGAAYNPTTNAWRVLPNAPLTARTGQTAVWTGTEMIVWGGTDGISHTYMEVAPDGAAYNPTTNAWRRLPPSPLTPRTEAIGVWTGHTMIVLGGQAALLPNAFPPASTNGDQGDRVDGAAYDPADNRWRRLAAPVPLAGHPLTWDTAVQAGPHLLLAWTQWSTTRGIGPSTSETTGGADLYRLDESTGRWTDVVTASNALPSVGEAIWTGNRAVVRGIRYNCGACPGPFVPEVTALYDPTTNSWRRLPADPLGSENAASAWTGAALFSFDGSASVYDPSRDHWTRLAPAPFACAASGAPVWTGHELLDYCPQGASGSSGLAYVPAPTAPAPTLPAASSSTPRAPAKDAIAFTRGDAIWTIEPSGSGLRRLTPPGCCSGARWNPAHTQLALSFNEQLTVLNATGARATAFDPSTIFAPAWSPDGTQIAFAASPAGGSNGGPIEVVTTTGDPSPRVVANVFAGALSWSPDGKQIAFTDLTEPLHVELVTVATGSIHALATGTAAETFDPAWSARTGRIAFASADGLQDIDPGGGGRRQLVTCSSQPCNIASPTWSPDGGTIVYSRAVDGTAQLFAVDVASRQIRQLTSGAAASDSPSW